MLNTKLYKRVHSLAETLLNAAHKNDSSLFDKLYEELKQLCLENENSGKNHPVQWETLADFTEDADEALTVYKKALDYAEASSENDYIASIHYSMAIILKEMGQSEQALDSALKANEQLNNIGDDTLQEEISELLASLR